jgi:hypothetical protein
MEHCVSCHNAWPYRWTEPNKYGKRFVLVGLTPQTMWKQIARNPRRSGDLR